MFTNKSTDPHFEIWSLLTLFEFFDIFCTFCQNGHSDLKWHLVAHPSFLMCHFDVPAHLWSVSFLDTFQHAKCASMISTDLTHVVMSDQATLSPTSINQYVIWGHLATHLWFLLIVQHMHKPHSSTAFLSIKHSPHVPFGHISTLCTTCAYRHSTCHFTHPVVNQLTPYFNMCTFAHTCTSSRDHRSHMHQLAVYFDYFWPLEPYRHAGGHISAIIYAILHIFDLCLLLIVSFYALFWCILMIFDHFCTFCTFAHALYCL